MTGAPGWRPQFRSSESLFFSTSQLANLDFMSDSMTRDEVRKILENAWSVVDSEFDKEFILGPAVAHSSLRLTPSRRPTTRSTWSLVYATSRPLPCSRARTHRSIASPWVSPNTEISDDRSAAQSCHGDRPSHERHCPGKARRHGNDCQCGADCDGRVCKISLHMLFSSESAGIGMW